MRKQNRLVDRVRMGGVAAGTKKKRSRRNTATCFIHRTGFPSAPWRVPKPPKSSVPFLCFHTIFAIGQWEDIVIGKRSTKGGWSCGLRLKSTSTPVALGVHDLAAAPFSRFQGRGRSIRLLTAAGVTDPSGRLGGGIHMEQDRRPKKKKCL